MSSRSFSDIQKNLPLCIFFFFFCLTFFLFSKTSGDTLRFRFASKRKSDQKRPGSRASANQLRVLSAQGSLATADSYSTLGEQVTAKDTRHSQTPEDRSVVQESPTQFDSNFPPYRHSVVSTCTLTQILRFREPKRRERKTMRRTENFLFSIFHFIFFKYVPDRPSSRSPVADLRAMRTAPQHRPLMASEAIMTRYVLCSHYPRSL